MCARADVPRCRFHDLRHLHASYLALTGVPLKVAQEHLGHATVMMTAGIYQHTLGGQGAAARAGSRGSRAVCWDVRAWEMSRQEVPAEEPAGSDAR